VDVRATDRSDDAIEAVYRAHGDRIWRAVLAYAQDPEVASDAVAEAFAQPIVRGDALRSPVAWVWRSAFRIATLDVHVELPIMVRAGDTLRYTVVLNNPTASSVSLANCPSYTETLGYPNNQDLSFMLNCDRVTVIPPGKKVVYAMEFRVPSNAVTGPAKFNWHLNVPDGSFPGGGGVLAID
jgi:hypothetical protein